MTLCPDTYYHSLQDPIERIKLEMTACLRWSDRLGLSEGICNHFSVEVPGQPGTFLLNPQGLHWSEIKVSDIITVATDGTLIDGKHAPEPTAFFIHSGIHRNVAEYLQQGLFGVSLDFAVLFKLLLYLANIVQPLIFWN